MEKFPSPVPVTQESKSDNKEFFGKKFKESLYRAKERWEQSQRIKALVAGEGFVEAARNVTILKWALADFAGTAELPEKISQLIKVNLMSLESSDPTIDRLHYGQEQDVGAKNEIAMMHNEKLDQYAGSIRTLFKLLEEVLPEAMTTELQHRDSMFLQTLLWADSQK